MISRSENNMIIIYERNSTKMYVRLHLAFALRYLARRSRGVAIRRFGFCFFNTISIYNTIIGAGRFNTATINHL